MPIPVIELIDGFATEEQSGGAGQFGIQLARHLDRTVFQPIVVGLWRYGTPSERRWMRQLREEGIEALTLIEEPSRLSTDMLRADFYLRQIVTRTQAQVVNSHFERGDMLGITLQALHPRHPRIVRTQHADEQWQKRPWLGVAMNMVFPWVFDGEVAISQATREVMDARRSARLAGRRSTLIYNGLGTEIYEQLRHSARADSPLVGDHLRLIIIGRLEPQKDHAMALRAMRRILDRHPAAELWIVGSGSLQQAIERQVEELNLGAAVRFWGQRKDIPDLLAQADVLISSSIWEGFPTVVLEAMAAGVPVVATDVSGSRELVQNGQTGFLVAKEDDLGLAEAVLHMIEAPQDARQMALVAQQRVAEHTFAQVARRYEDLYIDILS